MYRLTTCISFGDLVTDDEDYKQYLTRIHRFIAQLPERCLVEQQNLGVIEIPENMEDYGMFHLKLILSSSHEVFAAGNMIRGFSEISMFTENDCPTIEYLANYVGPRLLV